jgi:hypothetical protein
MSDPKPKLISRVVQSESLGQPGPRVPEGARQRGDLPRPDRPLLSSHALYCTALHCIVLCPVLLFFTLARPRAVPGPPRGRGNSDTPTPNPNEHPICISLT